MGADELADLENDIKATGSDIAVDAERIREIEEEKVTLDLADPRLLELANESEAISAQVAVKAKVETALIEQAVRSVDQPDEA
jgi:hypothetical protein